VNVNSNKTVPLTGKLFHSFSKTGRQTVLVWKWARSLTIPSTLPDIDSIYIFDNEQAMVVDSLEIHTNDDAGVYFDDETGIVKAFPMDYSAEVTIRNVKTKEIIQKFMPSFQYREMQWSVDGTKLYYTGLRGEKKAMGIYDLISKKETVFDLPGTGQITLFPSVDNKKVLYNRIAYNEWYIKKLE
jgi:hypothetical protein